MCGICGIYDLKGHPIDGELLKRMADIIKHRGPDGEGFYANANVGLGHRRLSIIDLEGGSQPISNENGTIYIIFNGEIYNFIEELGRADSKDLRSGPPDLSEMSGEDEDHQFY